MKQVVLLMHMSLDGYCAGPNGELDWVLIDDEIQDHVEGLLSKVDAALYGRVTYQMMEGYWPTVPSNPDATPHERHHSAWVEAVHKVVFSRSLERLTRNNTTLVHDGLEQAVADLKQQHDGDLMIFGSPIIARTFMERG